MNALRTDVQEGVLTVQASADRIMLQAAQAIGLNTISFADSTGTD